MYKRIPRILAFFTSLSESICIIGFLVAYKKERAGAIAKCPMLLNISSTAVCITLDSRQKKKPGGAAYLELGLA